MANTIEFRIEQVTRGPRTGYFDNTYPSQFEGRLSKEEFAEIMAQLDKIKNDAKEESAARMRSMERAQWGMIGCCLCTGGLMYTFSATFYLRISIIPCMCWLMNQQEKRTQAFRQVQNDLLTEFGKINERLKLKEIQMLHWGESVERYKGNYQRVYIRVIIKTGKIW